MTAHSIREVAALVGVTPRLIRYWVTRGVLPPPAGRGRSARYTDEHLLRLRVIQKLRAERSSLRRIRELMKSQSLEELASLIPPASPASGSAAVPDAKPTGVQPAKGAWPPSLWDVIHVTRGLVIMACVEEGPELRRVAQEMYEAYHSIAAERVAAHRKAN